VKKFRAVIVAVGDRSGIPSSINRLNCERNRPVDHSALIDQYEAGADVLARGLEGLTNADLLAYPVPGTWSIQEIAIHLMDSDLIGSDRMKRTIAEERPSLLGYDENAFVKNLRYDLQDVHAAAAIFAANRRLFTVVLRAIPADAFARIGVHNENGPETLEHQLKKYIKHLEHHMTFLWKKRALLGKALEL
jgi:DinB superfamily